MCVLSHVQLSATPWTVAHQPPLSMEFSRQEHWSGLPFPPPGDLPNPVIKPTSPALAGGFFTAELLRNKVTPNKNLYLICKFFKEKESSYLNKYTIFNKYEYFKISIDMRLTSSD